MADWTDRWQDELDERTAALVERAQVHVDDLVVRYEGLRDMVQPGKGNTTGRRAAAGPSVPIRVDVVDLAREIDRFALRYAALLSGALRAGASRVRSVHDALVYVSDRLGPASLADPSLAVDVESAAASLRWRARHLVGEVEAAFPVDVPCPECGMPALWVHPGMGVVRCGMGECGHEWSVGDIAVPLWSASRPAKT